VKTDGWGETIESDEDSSSENNQIRNKNKIVPSKPVLAERKVEAQRKVETAKSENVLVVLVESGNKNEMIDLDLNEQHGDEGWGETIVSSEEEEKEEEKGKKRVEQMKEEKREEKKIEEKKIEEKKIGEKESLAVAAALELARRMAEEQSNATKAEQATETKVNITNQVDLCFYFFFCKNRNQRRRKLLAKRNPQKLLRSLRQREATTPSCKVKINISHSFISK
jgi:hypothetical protein